MPGQQPRPNKIPIANLRTEDECDAYIKAEAISLESIVPDATGVQLTL